MLKKIKHALGIESVKIELLEPRVNKDGGYVEVEVVFTSQNDATIESVELKCVEKYFRGRRSSKLIDEYTIGQLSLDESFLISKDEEIRKEYRIKVDPPKSEMDKLADGNFIFRGMVSVAKLLKGVKSVYRIEGEAKVKDMKLHPIARIDFDFE